MPSQARKNGSLKTKTESQVLVKEDPSRSKLIVTNVGVKTVYLSLSSKAEKEKGIALAKEGPPFVLENYQGEVTAFAFEEEPLILFVDI